MASDIQEHAAPQPTKRNWRLRWSLRFLIAGVTLVCIVFAWLGSIWHMGQVHDEVGKRIESLSPHSFFSSQIQWQLSEAKNISTTPGSGVYLITEVKQTPQWMQDSGTELFWQRIKSISLHDNLNREQIETAVKEITRLDQIEKLAIHIPNFPEQNIARILAAVQVNKLDLERTHLSPASLPWLRNAKLTDLNLSLTQFANTAVDDLPDSLERLNLMGTQIDDEGAAKLVRLKKLFYLNLRQTSVSREVIKQLDDNLPGCLIDWGE